MPDNSRFASEINPNELDIDHGGETEADIDSTEKRVALVQHLMSCKNFFFATVYVFWFLSLGISIAALFNSPEVDEDADKQV